MLANNHAAINLDPGTDKQRSPTFQVHQPVGNRFARRIGYKNPVAPSRNRADKRGIAVEYATHHAGSPGLGEKFTVIADQTPRRGDEGKPDLVAAGRAHVGHPALTNIHCLDHYAREFLVDIYPDFLERLKSFAGLFIFLVKYSGAADRQLEAFPAHGLDQDAKLQLSPSGDLESIGIAGLGNLNCDIAFAFAVQPLTDNPRSNLAAFPAADRRIVDRKGHRQCRWPNRRSLQRNLDTGGAQGIGNCRRGKSRNRNDLSGNDGIHGDPLQSPKYQKFAKFGLFHGFAVTA